MKVSVIMAVFNNKATIRYAIQSALKQNYPNIEIIVVDGASSDGTLDEIEFFSGQIKYISEPDNGIYDAMNKGIKLATGNIVGILNSDDIFADEDVISRVVQSFKSSGKEIIYSNVNFVANDKQKIIRHYSSRFFRPWMFRYGFQPAHPTFYTKRVNFEKYGFYKTNFKIAGDFELLVRFLFIEELSNQYINDTWVKMRLGGVSTSGLKSVYKLNLEILKACKNNGIYTNTIFIYSRYLFKWWGFLFNFKK